MKWCTVIMTGLAVAAMAGCAAPHEQSKADAEQRWHSARSDVLMTTGEERFMVGDLDAAADSARKAMTLSPELTSARMLLARVAIEKGNYTEAAEQLAEVGRLEPTDHRVPYLQAVVYERRGRYEQALRLYEKARAMAPTNPAYVVAAAEMLVALGRAGEALSLVETQLSRLADSTELDVLAGDLAMLTGDPGRASEHYTQARHQDPENADILEKLAKASFYAGDHVRVVMFLEDMVKRDRHRDCAWAHTMLGDARLGLGRNQDAKVAYQRAAELTPSMPDAWIKLATASLACNDLSRAVLSARRALRLDGDSAEASAVLGYALLAQGKSDEAQRMLTRAAQTHPSDPMLTCLLGRSYSAMGRTEEALAHYQATLQLDPDNLVARKMVAQLTQ